MNKTFDQLNKGAFFIFKGKKYKKVSNVTGVNKEVGCKEFQPECEVKEFLDFDKVPGMVIPKRASTINGRSID